MARWDKIKNRGNVEDRRGTRMVGTVGGIGVTGLVIALAIGVMIGPEQGFQVLDTLQKNQPQHSESYSSEFDGVDSYEVFASTVLGSNNALWKPSFEASGIEYESPRLVLFRDFTSSACGGATSKIGPHYCPLDSTIYLDERFFDELQTKFGAKGGDVAEAYVIAHEVAHHVQNILGFTQKVQDIRQHMPDQANQASIALELQADCFAGIWSASVAGLGVLEQGEISEAIDAAESVGDDRIQEAATGYINPETWTHGSSADRKKWFNIGYEYSDFEKCNTF